MTDTDYLTVEDAREALREIEANKEDGEVAHSLEDGLMTSFVASVASGKLKGKKAQEVAILIQEANAMSFSRWYA